MKYLIYKLKKVIKNKKIERNLAYKKLAYNLKKETIYNYLLGPRKEMLHRRTSTYSEQLKLTKFKLIYKNELQYIVYLGGFSTSLREALQLINNGLIEVNGHKVKNPKYKVEGGSIIKSLDPLCIFKYYTFKYHTRVPIRKYNKKWSYLRYEYMLLEKNIIRLSYNEIILIKEEIL